MGKFWIGLWYLFLPLLMQYKWTFFLCTKSSYSSILYLFSLGILASAFLSIVLLFHTFINNGNMFKNGAVECDEIYKHYGMNRINTIYFKVFQGHKNTMLSLLWKKFIKKNRKQFLVQMSSRTVKLISSKYFA